MKLKFIGQGFDPNSEENAGSTIISSLQSKEYHKVDIFVAFISIGGITNLIDELLDFRKNGGSIRIFLGIDLNATSKEALEELLKNNIESYIIYSPNNIIYHPKIYAFEGKDLTRAIVGSSNLTSGGLFQNIEASVLIDFENDDENGNNFIAEVYEHFNSIMNAEHQSCNKLTTEILDLLVVNKIVLPEATARAKRNRVSKEFETKDFDKNKDLLKLFGKIKPKKPPKVYKKNFTKEELVVKPDEKVTIAYETTTLVPGAMWIETGKMTGGSRNILDLSKMGKREGVAKFGSVSFFGIEPDDTATTKNISIHLGGIKYKDNPIFFAEDNSNWRVQLKGVSKNDEKLTTISKPRLGADGGFVDKILVFTRLGENDYRLEILDSDDMSILIDNSSDWARGGKAGSGRAYGII